MSAGVVVASVVVVVVAALLGVEFVFCVDDSVAAVEAAFAVAVGASVIATGGVVGVAVPHILLLLILVVDV